MQMQETASYRANNMVPPKSRPR